ADKETITELGYELRELLGVENDSEVTFELKNHGGAIVNNKKKTGSSLEDDISLPPAAIPAEAARRPSDATESAKKAISSHPANVSQASAKLSGAVPGAVKQAQWTPVALAASSSTSAVEASASAEPVKKTTTLKVSAAAYSAAYGGAALSGYANGQFTGYDQAGYQYAGTAASNTAGYDMSYGGNYMYYGGAEYSQSGYYDTAGQFHFHQQQSPKLEPKPDKKEQPA
ncbi:unnamed protein product, partial [Polarella glacialis]